MSQPLTAAVRYLSGEREPVRVATTTNITLQGLFVVDDVELEVGDRVLVKNQDDPVNNGIYLASAGVWFRAPDASWTRAINKGTTVTVQEGTAFANRAFVFQAQDPVVGTDAITVARYFGDTAFLNVGTTAGTVAAGDDERFVPDELQFSATRNGMEALQFPAGMNSLETRGFSAMGDGGGAQYIRVASEPTHGLKVRSLDRFLPSGAIDAVNGGWWEIAKAVLTPQMFGATSGADCTTEIQKLFAVVGRYFGEVFFPDADYYMSASVVQTITRNVSVKCAANAKFIGASFMTAELFRLTSAVEYENIAQWDGGSFDVSAVPSNTEGNTTTENPGTCISLNAMGAGWFVKNARFIAGADLDHTKADTAVAPVNCLGGEIMGNYVKGFSDIAFYVTGGNALDRSQEGGPTFVTGNVIEHCLTGISGKRGTNGIVIYGNRLYRCQNGIGVVGVGGAQNLDPGHHLIIEANLIKDTVIAPITLRGGLGRHKIHNNTIEDWGYGLDGNPTPVANKAAIDCRGVRDSSIQGNTIALVDRAKTSAHWGVGFENFTIDGEVYLHGGNLVTDNLFDNVQVSVRETQAGDSALLNDVYENRHRGVTTRYIEQTEGAFFWDTWIVPDVNFGWPSNLAAGAQSASQSLAIAGLRVGGVVSYVYRNFGGLVFDARLSTNVIVGNGNVSARLHNGTASVIDASGIRYNLMVKS